MLLLSLHHIQLQCSIFFDYFIQDPEISQALLDVAMNPANIAKYQTNPKIMEILRKMPSGVFPGAGGAKPSSPSPDEGDVGLD